MVDEVSKYIPLEQITVSGLFPGEFYPIWVNEWGKAEVNTKYELTLEGWLLAGETAYGIIRAGYADDDFASYPNQHLHLARKSFVDAKVTETNALLDEFLPLAGGILLSPIYLSGDPDTFDLDAAVTLGWTTQQSDLYLKVVGGERGSVEGGQQMTGPITLHSDLMSEYNDRDAVPMFYLNNTVTTNFQEALDQVTNQFIPLTGGTVTEHLTVPDPVDDCHAANFGFLKRTLNEKIATYFESKKDT